MLAYAFQILHEGDYKRIETEQFTNVADLCAEILAKGLSAQLKRGLGRGYIEINEPLSLLRGKIDFNVSIKTNSALKRQLVCTYDDFSVNSYLNRIIKTTIILLVKSDVDINRKKELRKILVYFAYVETLDIHSINWRIQFNRNNQTYQMLIAICELIIKGLLQTQSDGSTKIRNYIDDQLMCRLYEKFILQYFRKEHSNIKAEPSRINWQLDNDYDNMLPIMQTDITLSQGKKYLIIDTKWYSIIAQSNLGFNTWRSNHIYQIFTYVKNKEAELRDILGHRVSGMLLYAKTDEALQPNHTYQMQGNQITIRSLDLNCDFSKIREQLDSIASEYFFE